MTNQNAIEPAHECARDGTLLRDPRRVEPSYSLLRAYGHFRDLLKEKEETSHVFKIFEALPSKSFIPRVRALTLSERGEKLRAEEPFLPPILDDHEALRRLPEGSVAQAYCDFMEREGLSAAGLVAEDVRMARFHLVGDRARHIGEGEMSCFFRDPRMEHDLEQEVAEFAAQIGHVRTLDRIRDLIGFFDRIRGDRGEILRQIPFATALRIAQPRHDRQQAVQLRVLGGAHSRMIIYIMLNTAAHREVTKLHR